MPDPPFPSVADAIAAFDRDASPELLCGRCGLAGGLLRGDQSAVCAYCGFSRREEGDGIAFRGSLAYRWLLGSLGLDGSEAVEFDDDSVDSNKSKEVPTSGMVLSDLLDLKLTFPLDFESREISGSPRSTEQSSVTSTLNLPGVNLDSFFIERIEATAAAVLPRTDTVVQEKHCKNRESSGSEMHVASKGFESFGTKTGSESTHQMGASTSFANWDAGFQSTGSESVVGDSKQLDLFKSASVAEPSNFPASGTAITTVAAGNERNMKTTSLEHSEDLASASGTLNKDSLFIQKAAPAIVGNNSGVVTENSVAEFTGSYLNKNSVQSNKLPGRGEAGVSIDETFDDWQEFTGGGNQDIPPNVGERTKGPLVRGSSEVKTMDSLAVSCMGSSSNVVGDSDDWQAFASSSGQGGEGSMKPVEGSSSGLGFGGSVNQFEETGMSLEHSLEAHSVDLWPAGNVKEHNTTEVKQTDDSFDDWQDFTTSGQAQVASFSQAGEITEVSHVSHREIGVDSWFTANTGESRNIDLVNRNNVTLDDWQGFSGSDRAQQSLSNVGGELADISFGQHDGTGSVQLWANASSKGATDTVSTNMEDNAFDIWQDLTTSGHQQENSSNVGRETSASYPAKEIDTMSLWLTSNVKESNSSSKGVTRIDGSPDGWQDFASFGQAQGNMKIPVEGQFLEGPSGVEPVDLWSSSHTEEFKNLEQINENDDPFDFKNSPQLKVGLQDPPHVPLSDKPSVLRPDIPGLEFGSFALSALSQSQTDRANAVLSDEHLERTNGMQQMVDDALSTVQATSSHDNYSIPKSESGNANVEKLLSQMPDLSFILKDELSVPDKPADHSKS